MTNAGRIVIDTSGTILEADDIFAQAMRAPSGMVGGNALAITAPGDRDRCTMLMEKLCQNGEPVVTMKRLIRKDGTVFWVRNRLKLITGNGEPMIEVLLERSSPPSGWLEPAILLHVAKVVFDSRRGRAAAFGDTLFADHAWDMLLAAYICEAEGSVVTIARIHAWTGTPLTTASRWIRALAAQDLLEYEDGGSRELVTTPFRLTATAHSKFERYLTDLYESAAQGRIITLQG